MRPILFSLALALSMPLTAFAQDDAGKGVEVKKQTANSGAQTVVETPATRRREANEHITDPVTTRKGSGDPRPRDAYGTPVPKPIKGQGTNSSTDAMRAADKVR